jgi:hypothetical protein
MAYYFLASVMRPGAEPPSLHHHPHHTSVTINTNSKWKLQTIVGNDLYDLYVLRLKKHHHNFLKVLTPSTHHCPSVKHRCVILCTTPILAWKHGWQFIEIYCYVLQQWKMISILTDALLGDCYGQSSLAVEYCLGVQNNTCIVKVLKEEYLCCNKGPSWIEPSSNSP